MSDLSGIEFWTGWTDPVAANQGAVNQAKAQQAYENSARPATVSFTHTTIGTGDFVNTAVVPFGVIFTERPSFTSGLVLARIPDPTHWKYPRAQAAVYKWEQDANGRYTGAYLVYSIDVPPVRDVHAVELELEKLRQDAMYKNLEVGIYDSRYLTMELTKRQVDALNAQGAAQIILDDTQAQANQELRRGSSTAYTLAQAQLNAAIAAAQAAAPLKQADVEIHHEISFYGTAIKALPDSLYAEMQQL